MRVYRLAHELALARQPEPFRPAKSDNRWNSSDVQVAYAAESLALAALELLTYTGNYPSLTGYQLFTYELAHEEIEAVDPTVLPTDYTQTRRYGDSWAEERRILALKVPSVVVPLSYNYLINPSHPDFDDRKVKAQGAFVYDERIAKLVAAKAAH